MRQQYRHFLREGLARFRPGWLLRGATRYLSTPLATHRARPITGPVFASFVVSYSCNLRCVFCDAWRSAGGARQGERLSWDAISAAVSDLAQLGTMGLGITGGEPLLYPRLFDLIELAKSEGMVVHLNTNATKIDEDFASRIVELGVDSVNVSLDASQAGQHDELRGREGAFNAACQGLELLKAARKPSSRPRLVIVSVVDAETDVDGLHRLAEELGVDGLGFIPRHEIGGVPAAAMDAASMDGLDNKLKQLRSTSSILDNSQAYLDLFPRALRGEPAEMTCHTGVNHLVFDELGRIYPCMPYNAADRACGDLHRTSLREWWGSEEHSKAIKETRACRDCYWNCHTEMNLLFRRRGRF
ncbi:MAG: radical SAM protein [Planctomycetota bacterium]